MGSGLWVYYALWVVYTAGYIFSGPIPHQLIVSHWFRRNRGKAMGIVYVGNGLMGSVGSLLVKPLTERFGFRTALIDSGGAIVLICWPIAILILRDKPVRPGPISGRRQRAAGRSRAESHSFAELLSSYSFWLLLIGSFCAIGAVGAMNFHMKFVFLDQGFATRTGRGWRVAHRFRFDSLVKRGGPSADRRAGRPLFEEMGDDRDFRSGRRHDSESVCWCGPATAVLLYAFAVLFGFGLGADYMLIPLMAAEQFGVNSLGRAMAVILPVNTIGQTWLPYFVSILRDRLRKLFDRDGRGSCGCADRSDCDRDSSQG